jgi:hypothetical protein
MLKSPNRFARYGACEGLCYASQNSVEAADALIAQAMTAEDYTLRYYAVLAFGKPSGSRGFGSAAKRAGPALLKLAATDDLKRDPFRRLQGTAALIKSLFTNPNGAARDGGSDMCGILKEEDLAGLWGDIYKAAREQAPSGDQFAGGVHKGNLELLVKYRFKEGMDLIMYNIEHPRHGTRGYNPILVDLLKTYGTHAKPLVPVIREKIKGDLTEKEVGKKYFEDLEKKYQAIEASTKTPELRSIKK